PRIAQVSSDLDSMLSIAFAGDGDKGMMDLAAITLMQQLYTHLDHMFILHLSTIFFLIY
ncbi:hypothetical protein ACJX0J_040510, partial [Zea mays]